MVLIHGRGATAGDILQIADWIGVGGIAYIAPQAVERTWYPLPFLVPLEEISNNLLGGQGAGLTFVLYGAIIVLIARFQPGGILTLINRLWAQRNSKMPDVDAAKGAAHAP